MVETKEIVTNTKLGIGAVNDISIQEKYDELCKEITRLQEKYDENGYDCSPMIKLQRIEQHVDMKYKSNPLNISVVMNSLPQYISIEGSNEMIYNVDEDEYYRHAGSWSLKYKYIEGKLVADCEAAQNRT